MVHGQGAGRWLYSIGYAIVLDGYYIGRCLINPFFWALLLAGYGVYRKRPALIDPAYRSFFARPGLFLLTWLLVLFLIPFMILFVTGERPPLRICNMIIFFFLYGGIGAAVLAMNGLNRGMGGGGGGGDGGRDGGDGGGGGGEGGRSGRAAGYRYSAVFVVLLLAAGFVCKNNVSLVARDWYSGDGARYDREWNERYALIRACGKDSCVVPPLTRIPFAFLFSPDGTDFRMSEYFDKQVVVRKENPLFTP
jgi:hypothetical protein